MASTGMLSSQQINYRRVGPGQLYVAAAPTTDPGAGAGTEPTEAGYYAIFYADGEAKKVLKAGVVPFLTADNAGLDLKIKPSTVKFAPCVGTTTELVTGIETATAEVTMFEAWDPAKLVDIYGGQAADLITTVAAVGKAARSIALLGPQSYNTPYVAMWRMASPTVPGEFRHYFFPLCTMVPDLELKLNQKDELKSKLSFQLQCSPYLLNSQGFGVVVISDDPTAPAQS